MGREVGYDMTLSHTFPPAALGWLGSAFEEKSRVSPLGRLDPGDFVEEDKTDLVQAGVIDEEGQFTPAWYVAVKQLAEPDAFARIRLSSGPIRAERVVYFRGSERDTVSLTPTPDGLRIDYGAGIDSFLLEVAALTGDSSVVNSSFAAELDYGQALVLCALIDLHRLGVLRSWADEEDYTFSALPADEVLARALDPSPRPQALTGVMQSLKGRPEDLTPKQAEACLGSLAELDLLASSDGGYLPSDELKRLAGNLLIFQGMVHLDAGHVDENGRLEMLETLFVQGGLHDILRIDHGGGSLTLEAVSSAVLLGYIRAMLTTPPRPEEEESDQTA